MMYYILLICCSLWITQVSAMNGHENGNGSSHNGSSAVVSLEDRLITSFDSVLEEARDNPKTREALRDIRHNTETNEDFGTNEKNEESFKKWILCFRSLLILSQVGHPTNQHKYAEVLRKAFDYKLRLLHTTMLAYIPDEYIAAPLKYYEGVWEQVATFDPEERKKLIQAYQNPEFTIDSKKAAFWEQYNFIY